VEYLYKIKYYETGVGFYKPNTHSGSWFDLGSDAYYGNFSGNVVNVPVFLKWEFRLYKNFKGNFKLGLSIISRLNLYMKIIRQISKQIILSIITVLFNQWD
jgi:hypothetical protein